jgi:hypothetical protein
MVESPVLLVTFANPEYTRRTFDEIKKAKPKKFYFYSNKARPDKSQEIERNDQVRAFINEIDWECSVKTYFRDEYVDVYTSLWGAIDWIFENEEQAIIFEDDCVPSQAFFDFCDQLLPQFKDDLRVWVISGNNFIEGYNPNGYDYIFSRFPYMYGWASWRSRWNKVLRDGIPIDEMLNYCLYKELFVTDFATRHRQQIAVRTAQSKAWDYVLHSTINCNGGMGIVPLVNLVSNIGVKGVHQSKAKGSKFIHNRKVSDKDKYPINNPPPFIVPDFKYDQRFARKRYRRSLFLQKTIKIIKKIIKH